MRKTNAKTNGTVNKSNGKAKVNGMAKAKVNEFEAIMNAINGIATEIAEIRADVDMLKAEEKAEKKSAKATVKTTNKANGKKTSAKTTATKEKAKKSAKKTAPTTRAEAIEQWCESKGITEEDRAAYGEAKREIRDEMMAENKKMVKTVKGVKVYDDNYYVGKKWTREFNKRMKERGFSVK